MSFVLGACADERQQPITAATEAGISSNWAPFTCGVAYSSTTTLYDSDLGAYGVPEITETERTCETWTGSDYRMYVQETGSSVTDPEISNDVITTWYEYGNVRAYDANGAEIPEVGAVAADAFALGLATPEEKQASYNDPYYGIYQGVEPEPCPNDPQAIVCNSGGMYSRAAPGPSYSAAAGNGMAAGRNPDAGQVGRNDHGFRRKAVRALLANSTEVSRTGEGRRFRSVRGDEETVLTIDPATELVVRQEVTTPRGRTRAVLRWARVKRKDGGEGYLRQEMEVVGVDASGKQTSRSTVLITDIAFNGGAS